MEKHRAGREHERGGAAGEQIGWEKGRGSLRERWTAWAKLNDSTILLCSGNGKSPPGEYSACKSIELLSIITMLPNTPPPTLPFRSLPRNGPLLLPSFIFSLLFLPSMHLWNEKAYWEASWGPREVVWAWPIWSRCIGVHVHLCVCVSGRSWLVSYGNGVVVQLYWFTCVVDMRWKHASLSLSIHRVGRKTERDWWR